VPCDADELERAIAVLAGGGLVAFPTETVWGIAADARRPEAVERLRRFKGRDPAQPISVLVDQPAELAGLGCAVDVVARALIEALWPGPVTLVLPVEPGTAGPAARLVHRAGGGGPEAAGPGAGGLGVRCSPHPVARGLARAAARAGIGPLTATSCNRSGEPPARTRAEARAVCRDGRGAPLVLETGEEASGGAPSTVLDLCVRPVRVLRPGAVDAATIRDVLAEIPQAGGGPATASEA
jgi:L-threonylcarbamoyladenylate synthase